MTRDVKLDKKDRIILSLTHDSQETSQGEIAKKIHLSQPSVAIQIKKLKERGFINRLMGVEFK
jgi:DNA-binding Lrp family transcriptional regulator